MLSDLVGVHVNLFSTFPGVRDTRLTVNAADKERDSTLRESQGASAVSDDPAVVEETTVKEYIKLIKCREYVTKKKNSKSGRVLSVSYRKVGRERKRGVGMDGEIGCKVDWKRFAKLSLTKLTGNDIQLHLHFTTCQQIK